MPGSTGYIDKNGVAQSWGGSKPSTSYFGISGGGGGTSSYDPVFGGKPAPVNVSAEIKNAIAAALANFGSLTNLAGQANQFNQQEILDQLATALPGYSNLVSQSSENIADNLSGLIPQDVQDAIQNSAAARAVGGGYGGSGLARNLVARDLGTTSMGLKNLGVQQAQAQASNTRQTATGPLMDLQNQLITALQSADITAGNNQVAAAPDPRARAEYEQSLFDKYYGMGMNAANQAMAGAQGAIPAGGMPNLGPSWATPKPQQTFAPAPAPAPRYQTGVIDYGLYQSQLARNPMFNSQPQTQQYQYQPQSFSPPGATDYGYGVSATLPGPGYVAPTPGIYQPPNAVDYGYGVGANTPGPDYGAPMEQYGPPPPTWFDQMMNAYDTGGDYFD